MKARLFTIVWGQRHMDWFERACVASLAQPRNKAALHRYVDRWDIVTREDNAENAQKIAERIGVPVEIHTAHIVAGPAGTVLQTEIVCEMARCYPDYAMLMAPPDTIFGEGSIETICTIGERPGVCVTVPHVRVTPKILDVPDFASSNDRLVANAWKHLHRTWVEANAKRDLTNSFSGGVSWQEIAPGIIAVTHRLPTVYLAQFNESDLGWWSAQTGPKQMGAWDHFWPSKLVAEQRQRVIGSSDAAFIAEVTPEFSNIPPCGKTNPDEPDRYHGNAAHVWSNRNIVAIFRAAS